MYHFSIYGSALTSRSMLPAELRYLMGFSSWRVLAENPKSLVDLHRSSAMRAYRHIKNAHGAMSDSIKRGLPKSQAWNTHMLLLIRAAHAHISYFVLDSFFTGLNHVKDTSAKRVLTELCHLFALTQLYPQTTSSASVLAYSTAQDYATIAAEEVDRLLDALTPNAIALTDAWDFSDASLASAIGCADGNVYERMMSWTRQLPINVNAKKPGGFGTAESWARYMKPALNLDLGEKRETKADARFGQGGRARL
jgi:acyl-CoA oxidase